ncbi:hypothetical protein ASPCAL11261 [Aspergillus calidoustus]|uniref:Uncharacterized protein n=1 Tax=Aspergillus calidoustus TaxID=454130 RepID=A0A0U5CE42_ASPCI|nr:hypothetical protein ASPCAL11261 [Aspergillus calidoustus]
MMCEDQTTWGNSRGCRILHCWWFTPALALARVSVVRVIHLVSHKYASNLTKHLTRIHAILEIRNREALSSLITTTLFPAAYAAHRGRVDIEVPTFVRGTQTAIPSLNWGIRAQPDLDLAFGG